MPGGSAWRRAHADGHVHGHDEREKLASVASSISVSDATHAHAATHAHMLFLSSHKNLPFSHFINGTKTENIENFDDHLSLILT